MQLEHNLNDGKDAAAIICDGRYVSGTEMFVGGKCLVVGFQGAVCSAWQLCKWTCCIGIWIYES